MRNLFAMGLLCMLLLCDPTLAASPADVDAAINRAKAFLYAHQNGDGTWETHDRNEKHSNAVVNYGSDTAVTVYALLAAGDTPGDPRLVRAIQFLKTEEMRFTYALAMRTQVWLFLPDHEEARRLAVRDMRMLLASADANARYDYDASRRGKSGHDGPHNSASQYAQLAMWACEQLDAEIPAAYWRAVEKGWISCQGDNGSWSYLPVKPNSNPNDKLAGSSKTMTSAGIASLLIAREFLNSGGTCRGNVPMPDVDKAFNWLGSNWNSPFDGWDEGKPATWYGYERIGLLSGLKYFGGHNWYQEGLDRILKSQRPDGSWLGYQPTYPMAATALNVLFLARGRAPIIVNKLAYEIDDNGKRVTGPWNQRSRDCWNMTNWLDHQLETRLAWQSIDVNSASSDDMLDAPILFIAGDKPLSFTDQQVERLRQYVLSGGLILGNPDCGSSAFTQSFVSLGRRLFPAYEFRDLPPTHPIFANANSALKKRMSAINMRGLSNGVRELMLLPTADCSKSYQIRDDVGRVEHFELFKNILFYAVDQTGLRTRGETYIVKPDPNVKTTKAVRVARLQYNGNWDPEPAGWQRLSAIVRNANKIDLQISPIKLGEGKLVTDGHRSFDIAHLTGTENISLSPVEWAEVKRFIDAGGLLVVDAAGGDAQFAEHAETEIVETLGSETATQLRDPLPLTNPLYNQGSPRIESVKFRSFARSRLGHLQRPQLRGITIKGRLAVIFSREDLSGGLVGQQVDGIVGYSPASAATLVQAIIAYVAS